MAKKAKKTQIEDFLDRDVRVAIMAAARVNTRSVQEEVNLRLRAVLGGSERLNPGLRHVG